MSTPITGYPPAPAVTVFADDAPCPRVEIVVSPMPAGAATLTIWRDWDGNRALVRGASNVPAAGDTVVIDYETPLQTPIRYVYQTTDADGTPSMLSVFSAPVTVNDARLWLQDPLDPGSAFPCTLARSPYPGLSKAVFRRGSFAPVEHVMSATVTEVFGSDLPVGMGGVRQQPEQIPMEVRTSDADTTDALRGLIHQAAVLLVRTGTRVPMLPTLAYLILPSVSERFVYGPDITIWQATGQMVAPPTSPVLIAVRTLDSLGLEADTLDALGALYTTLLDLERGHNA